MRKFAMLLIYAVFLTLLLCSYHAGFNNFLHMVGPTGPYGLYPWQIKVASLYAPKGYASSTSCKNGDTVKFYVKSYTPFRADIYRMGEKGVLMKSINNILPCAQQSAIHPHTMDANWKESFRFKVPNWKSGFYLVKISDHWHRSSYIPLVVREGQRGADFGVVIPTNTYQAYNNWGGKSLYPFSSENGQAATTLSFSRPINYGCGAGDFFIYDYPLICWMERKGYSITYFTDQDVHNGILDNVNISALIIPGHSEYWTKNMRDQVEKHVKKGMNMGVFGANIAYWQVRLEEKERYLTCYRNPKKDPMLQKDPLQVTTRFRSSVIGRPEDELYGAMYQGIPDKVYPLTIGETNHWIFKGTKLKKGDKLYGIVGGEVDSNMRGIKGSRVIIRSLVNGKNSNFGQKAFFSDVIWMDTPGRGKVFATGTFRWQKYLEKTEGWGLEYEGISVMTSNVLDRLRVRTNY